MDQKLNFFIWVINDQIQDLTISAKSMREWILEIDPGSTTNETILFLIMCAMSMLAFLAKLWEALDHYNKEINSFPEAIKLDLIKLKSEFKQEEFTHIEINMAHI